jgi:hypothetical protein
MDYTLGLLDKEANYLTDVIRFRLTRNTGVIFNEVNDEIVKALGECIPATSDGMWYTYARQVDNLGI